MTYMEIHFLGVRRYKVYMIKLEKCPICGGEMKWGYIYSPESRASYWLPGGEPFSFLNYSSENIKKSGGFVLGSATKIGFFAKKRPKSYLCVHCKIIVTVNDEQE